MLLKLQQYFIKVHPAFTKGFVSICIGFFIFQQMWFGGDDAAKYIEPHILFWLNWLLGSCAIILNQTRDALSAYFNDKTKEAKTIPPTV
jgi:Flp pilus assembly protein protease CpaA